MSLFHKSHPAGGPVTFSSQESVIALLFLVVTADGDISKAEEELVIAASNRMKLLRGLSIEKFNDAVQKVRQAIEASGRDAVYEAAFQALPPMLHATVYALAADIASADGGVLREEADFLRKLQEAFGISDDFATRILEVMRIKNCG